MSESHLPINPPRKNDGSFLPMAALVMLVVFGPALLAWALTVVRH